MPAIRHHPPDPRAPRPRPSPPPLPDPGSSRAARRPRSPAQCRLVGRLQRPVQARKWPLLLSAHRPGRLLRYLLACDGLEGRCLQPTQQVSAGSSAPTGSRAHPLGQWAALCLVCPRPPLPTQRLVAAARDSRPSSSSRPPTAEWPPRAHAPGLKAETTRPAGQLLGPSSGASTPSGVPSTRSAPRGRSTSAARRRSAHPVGRLYVRRLRPDHLSEHFEIRRVSTNGGIRWHKRWVNVSHILATLPVGLEPLASGTWNVFFGPVHLGWLDERDYRIHDHRGRSSANTTCHPSGDNTCYPSGETFTGAGR